MGCGDGNGGTSNRRQRVPGSGISREVLVDVVFARNDIFRSHLIEVKIGKGGAVLFGNPQADGFAEAIIIASP